MSIRGMLCFFFIAIPSLVESFQPFSAFQSSRSLSFHYNTGVHVLPSVSMSESPEIIVPPVSAPVASPSITSIGGKEPFINKINSLDELQYFLQEDEDRLVAIKFYAPWCKTCQRLGNHFGRLAREWGDGVLNRNFVEGRIRCAEVEFKTVETSRWVTEELSIPAIPTLQLYSGVTKLWQGVGAQNTKLLQDQLHKLEHLSPDDLRALGESRDDGVLQQAMEDSFYSTPDFLNEEW